MLYEISWKSVPWEPIVPFERTDRHDKANSLFSQLCERALKTCHFFMHLVVCLTTGPKPLPERALHIVRSRASSFKWEYPLLSLRSSNSFLRLLPCLPVTDTCVLHMLKCWYPRTTYVEVLIPTYYVCWSADTYVLRMLKCWYLRTTYVEEIRFHRS